MKTCLIALSTLFCLLSPFAISLTASTGFADDSSVNLQINTPDFSAASGCAYSVMSYDLIYKADPYNAHTTKSDELLVDLASYSENSDGGFVNQGTGFNIPRSLLPLQEGLKTSLRTIDYPSDELTLSYNQGVLTFVNDQTKSLGSRETVVLKVSDDLKQVLSGDYTFETTGWRVIFGRNKKTAHCEFSQ